VGVRDEVSDALGRVVSRIDGRDPGDRDYPGRYALRGLPRCERSERRFEARVTYDDDVLVVARVKSLGRETAGVGNDGNRSVVAGKDPYDRALIAMGDRGRVILHDVVVKSDGYALEEPQLSCRRHELNGMECYSYELGIAEPAGGQELGDSPRVRLPAEVD
jgi:hypothetical protein